MKNEREKENSSLQEKLINRPLIGDELTELRAVSNPSPSPGCIVVAILAFVVLFFFHGILWSLNHIAGDILALIFLMVLTWQLWRLFPSIWKIFPLRRQILQMHSEKAVTARDGETPPAHRINTSDQLDFMSRLMELGSRELSLVHFTQSNNQSLEVKKSLYYSHLISALWAASIIILMVLLFKPQWISQSFDFALVCWFGSPVAATWLWIVHTQEYRLRLHRLHLVQRDRDRFAAEVSKMLLHEADEYANKELPLDFGLYLRAFMTTDKLHLGGVDFETLLAYSIAPTLALIALGKPGEHIGAGRIQTTDEHWQEEILRLMRRARLILIIPSYRDGTLWEIATLRQLGHFEKTIFIMPPELEFHGAKYSDDWHKTIAAGRSVGIEFPAHVPSGRLFRLSSDGKLENSATLLSEEFHKEIALDPVYILNTGAESAAAVDTGPDNDIDENIDEASDHDHDAGTYAY